MFVKMAFLSFYDVYTVLNQWIGMNRLIGLAFFYPLSLFLCYFVLYNTITFFVGSFSRER